MNLQRGFLLTLTALLFILSATLIQPLLQYLLLAVVLAVVLFPLRRRLAPRIGRTPTAAVLLVGAVIVLFIPFVVVAATVAQDAAQLIDQIRGGGVGLQGIGTVQRAESLIEGYTNQQIDISAAVNTVARRAAEMIATSAPGILGTISGILIGLGVTVFLLFFLLRDGDKLLAWLREITPLPTEVQDDLYSNLDDIAWAVLLGHALVAITQGTIAGIGLFVVGIPNAVFWTFIMVILAFIPIIGAFLVWGPAAIYLIATGQPVFGIGLAVYGTVVVNATDNFLRPVLVNRRASLNPAIIIVGIIGGVYLVGFMGLFVGPIIVGSLKAVLEIFDEYYEEF